jgi:hypothetical protein
LVQEASVCIFLDLGFNFHLEFRQYKFTEVCSDSFQLLHQQVKLSLLFALPQLQSEIKVALYLFASHSFLANYLRFMVKLIDKAIVINVKIHKNERKRLYSNNKESLTC